MPLATEISIGRRPRQSGCHRSHRGAFVWQHQAGDSRSTRSA